MRLSTTDQQSDSSLSDDSAGSEFDFDATGDTRASSGDEGGALSGSSPRRNYTTVRVFEPFSAAYSAMSANRKEVHTYETRYETGRVLARVYRCRSHTDCHHRFKIKTLTNDDDHGRAHLEQSGRHGLETTAVRRRGIHHLLIEEIDALLEMGWGSKQLRGMLQHRYRKQPRQLTVATSKLENRKAFLVRRSSNGWDISNHASFNAWAGESVCSTREVSSMVDDPTDERMDTLLVLDAFAFEGQSDIEGTSFGVVVTSRRVFCNVRTAVVNQGDHLVCTADGTYKLYFGGWTVVECGTIALGWSRGKFAHRFILWAYMFVRTEPAAAYKRLFQTVRDRALLFLGVEVRVSYGSLDHSEAIAAAFLRVWPDVVLITCWSHMARNVCMKKSLLVKEEMYEEMIKPGVLLLRSARTHKQFCKLAVVVVDNWISYGESDFAEWFKEIYLTDRWDRWHINGSGVGGVTPSQQGIESHHGVIKKRVCPARELQLVECLRAYCREF